MKQNYRIDVTTYNRLHTLHIWMLAKNHVWCLCLFAHFIQFNWMCIDIQFVIGFISNTFNMHEQCLIRIDHLQNKIDFQNTNFSSTLFVRLLASHFVESILNIQTNEKMLIDAFECWITWKWNFSWWKKVLKREFFWAKK